jgi:hypothetical protein
MLATMAERITAMKIALNVRMNATDVSFRKSALAFH